MHHHPASVMLGSELRLSLSLSLNIKVWVCAHGCAGYEHMNARVLGGLDPPDLDLQAIRNHLTWVLETELDLP